MGLSRTREHPWLDRYAILVTFCTFLLVITGARVSLHDAGLSRSFYLPPLTGGIRYEAERWLFAGLDGLLTVFLGLWIWARDPCSWLRKLAG